MKNYYTLLEIDQKADLTTVKKAYRKLAIQYHPDKNSSPKASQMFIEITEAYEVLKNPESRKEYNLLYADFCSRKIIMDYTTHVQAWKDYGQQKAREYCTMSFDNFTKRVFDEVKIGASYGVHFLLIAFCVFALISTPIYFLIDPLLGIFCLLLYGGLGYMLFNRTRKSYQNDRKQKFNN